MLIELNSAGLFAGGAWRARHISFAVDAGQIVTLIGPNGAGKSTSVKMALGIEKPTEGVCQRKPNLSVGYVPQKLAIDWTMPMSVKRFMRLTNPLSDQEIQQALTDVGVFQHLHHPVTELSGGEFQRVLIARAIARRPELLVLDEPAQGIDVAGEAQIYQLIQKVRDQLNCGVLLISHDLHIVMGQTDTVVCINGHVCCHGSPTSVANNPEYQALFGPEAASQLAVYDHQHDHDHHHDHATCRGHDHA